MKLCVRWRFPGTCHSLEKMILTSHAHIEYTLLTSGPPQLYKDTVQIYPPQVNRLSTLVDRARVRKATLTLDVIGIIGGMKVELYR